MCSCPSRTDEPEGEGHNQSPNHLAADLTTNQDLNGIANSRETRNHNARAIPGPSAGMDHNPQLIANKPPDCERCGGSHSADGNLTCTGRLGGVGGNDGRKTAAMEVPPVPPPPPTTAERGVTAWVTRLKEIFVAYAKFVGPGFMIAVAYSKSHSTRRCVSLSNQVTFAVDPGNYATDIAAGSSYRFQLLFIVLLSNIFAIILQSLAIKLGTVTGLDLASACRAFLPRWLNYTLYAMAEVAIIATDIAEVIGTAIALNLLIPKLPLVAGCALSILDVMIILFFYNPSGNLRGLRLFEAFVCLLVLGVVVCFCIQLSLITDTNVGDVFRGYLPSGAIVEQQGRVHPLYQACGILGATVMPHSLFLGSGIVQPRLLDYDTKHGHLPPTPSRASSPSTSGYEKTHYTPSLPAIKHCLKYSILELAISLFTFALFVNSAILIVAGASLHSASESDLDTKDIFSIHALLSSTISPAAGTIFALALLLSGVSAGIVCTIAGQMVSEGALRWRMRPWLRRLVTRAISITPSIIIAGAVGRQGLGDALTASQVVLSSVLPFVTAPLIWFTCLSRYMTVRPGMAGFRVEEGARTALFARRRWEGGAEGGIKMANSWWLSILAGLVWLVIAVMNVANLALLGLGRA